MENQKKSLKKIEKKLPLNLGLSTTRQELQHTIPLLP